MVWDGAASTMAGAPRPCASTAGAPDQERAGTRTATREAALAVLRIKNCRRDMGRDMDMSMILSRLPSTLMTGR
jgi:hypothetical protein